jgi:uncharacterized protein (TIGR03492 family)
VSRALFVSNGHGEAAIADRIAGECTRLMPSLQLEHLALVGNAASPSMPDVGPRRAMPSGGLIAMGNLPNIARDVRAGLIGLTLAQIGFLRSVRYGYQVAVAVGDIYALAMTSIVRAPLVFVGTAKSAHVARYGLLERRILGKSAACFVRDEATARQLAERGVRAEAANVIADLFADDDSRADDAVKGFDPALALLPGSRSSAYADGARLLAVTRELARLRPHLGAVLSISPGLEAAGFEAAARQAGWDVAPGTNAEIPFELKLEGSVRVRGWRGSLGPLFARATIVLGQAGTANEGAAAMGIPVAAFADERMGKPSWYRHRQQGLLGAALAVLPDQAADAAATVGALLDDPARRARMSQEGRARMGGRGAARRIAQRITQCAAAGDPVE